MSTDPSSYPPPAPGPGPSGSPIENHFVFAVVATVFATIFSMLSCCCLPLGLATGIPAILASNKVKMFVAQGEDAAARAASEKAKMWSWITAGLAAMFALIFTASMILNLSGMGGPGGFQDVLKEIEKAQKH
jgi:hypothetical protein